MLVNRLRVDAVGQSPKPALDEVRAGQHRSKGRVHLVSETRHDLAQGAQPIPIQHLGLGVFQCPQLGLERVGLVGESLGLLRLPVQLAVLALGAVDQVMLEAQVGGLVAQDLEHRADPAVLLANRTQGDLVIVLRSRVLGRRMGQMPAVEGALIDHLHRKTGGA